MQWYDALVGEPFLNWLRKVSDEKNAPHVKGDPFATSMRDFDDVTPHLRSISNGVAAERQRMTDLRGARLVEGEKLSALGDAVLQGWDTFGVADDKYEHELPRQLILVCEALIRSEPFYTGLMSFWRDKAAVYGADSLVEKWTDLFVQTYFSASLDGYCPMEHIRQLNQMPLWDGQELRAKVASIVSNSDKALVGLDKIIKTLDAALSRGKARKIFIIALCLAAEPYQSYAQDKLGKWTLPLTSNTGLTQHSILTASVASICSKILATYEVKLRSQFNSNLSPKYLDLLLKRKNVIFFGPPGTGKTYGAHQIEDYWRGKHGIESVISTTFHPTYSYEDFVWGWRPDGNNEGFVGQDGALLQACNIARGGTPTLLLIDEINRADTARVFGELITYIEADKRERPFRIAQDSVSDRMIPHNLFILGTMNTADRSVSLLDVALRRRFAFVEYMPDASIFEKNPNWASTIEGISVADLMNSINSRLSEVGVESDRAIGHALFGVSQNLLALDELRDRIQYDIYPLVMDYCFSDRARVSQVLGDLVNREGRINEMDDTQFITALRGILG